MSEPSMSIRAHSSRRRAAKPVVEALEEIQLLSAYQTLTYSDSLPSQIIDGKSRSLSVAQFDSALGTLMSAKVTITGNVSANVSLTSHGPSDEQVTATTTASYVFSGSSISQQTIGPQTASTTQTVPSGGTIALNVTVPPMPATYTLVTSTTLAPYEGTGNVSFSFNPSATTTTTASGNVSVTAVTSASATVSVTYTYATPENCPTVQTLVQGAHHQYSSIVLTASGPLDATQATTKSNYVLQAWPTDAIAGVRNPVNVPIKTVTYDSTTHTVTIVPGIRVSDRYTFALWVNKVVASPEDGFLAPDGSCGDYAILINRGTHVRVHDERNDCVSMGISAGGFLTVERSPAGVIQQVFIQNVYANKHQLSPTKSSFTGTAHLAICGTGPAIIHDLVGGNHVTVKIRPSKLQIAKITAADLPAVSTK